jgi:hypothetical protein
MDHNKGDYRMNYEIHKATTRTKLPPRAEPYWATPLGINQSIGFRKTGAIGTDEGTWIARRRPIGRT